MPRASLGAHPLLIGFDAIDAQLERAMKSAGASYPPYNIEQRGADAFRIILAVAGFGVADLAIRVEDETLLIVEGGAALSGEDPAADRFLHRGIAKRRFERCFVLAPGLSVGAARLERGLLLIDLGRAPSSKGDHAVAIAAEALD